MSSFTMDSVVGGSEVAAPIVGGGASLVSSLQALSIVDATALPRLIPFERCSGRSVKYKLMVAAVEKITNNLTTMTKCYVWLDFGCINQDLGACDEYY